MGAEKGVGLVGLGSMSLGICQPVERISGDQLPSCCQGASSLEASVRPFSSDIVMFQTQVGKRGRLFVDLKHHWRSVFLFSF